MYFELGVERDRTVGASIDFFFLLQKSTYWSHSMCAFQPWFLLEPLCLNGLEPNLNPWFKGLSTGSCTAYN